MTNNYFATAFVRTDSVGLTVRAENIGTAFELAENYLRERYPRSEVIVQAVQCIFNEFGSNSMRAITTCKLDENELLLKNSSCGLG